MTCLNQILTSFTYLFVFGLLHALCPNAIFRKFQFFFSSFFFSMSREPFLHQSRTPSTYDVRIFYFLSVPLFDECLLRNLPKKRNYNDDDDADDDEEEEEE